MIGPVTMLTVENRSQDFVAIASLTQVEYVLSTICSREFKDLIHSHYHNIVRLAHASTYQFGILLLTGQELGMSFGDAFEPESWGIK